MVDIDAQKKKMGFEADNYKFMHKENELRMALEHFKENLPSDPETSDRNKVGDIHVLSPTLELTG
jgi:hypothetical protein